MTAKRIFTLALCAVLLLTFSVTAYARGHGSRAERLACNRVMQQHFEICTFEDCNIIGSHRHDDVWYCSRICLQYEFELCPVANCSVLGIHEHDGVFYRCAYYGIGFGCGYFGTGYRNENRPGMEHGNRQRNGSCRNR